MLSHMKDEIWENDIIYKQVSVVSNGIYCLNSHIFQIPLNAVLTRKQRKIGRIKK